MPAATMDPATFHDTDLDGVKGRLGKGKIILECLRKRRAHKNPQLSHIDYKQIPARGNFFHRLTEKTSSTKARPARKGVLEQSLLLAPLLRT